MRYFNFAIARPVSRRAAIDEAAWTPIHYPNAVWDEDEQRLISNAEVAEIEFTAFTSRPKNQHIDARLIVRRVKRLNPATVPTGQEALFLTYRHHGVFTDNPMPMLDTEQCHRQHAVIEQVNADLKSGALAHLPPGRSPRTPRGRPSSGYRRLTMRSLNSRFDRLALTNRWSHQGGKRQTEDDCQVGA